MLTPRTFCLATLAVALLVLFPSPGFTAEIPGSESTPRKVAAVSCSIVDTHEFNGFTVIQFHLPVLSTYSYLLVSDGQALVVDPGREVRVYLDAAKEAGAVIMGVYLSHSHADFIAGHMELVQAAARPIFQSEKSNTEYAITPLSDGSTFSVGKALVRFLDTPGHTPDGGCALVFGPDDTNTPKLAFTGDVLLVGGVGRPGLMGGAVSPAALAGAAYDSWHDKLSKLDDSVLVFPAHGAGSLCGVHLSDEPYSTIGQERAQNPYLQHRARGAFVAALLEGLPQAPQYFAHNAALNKKGPPLLDKNASVSMISAPDARLADPELAFVADVRSADEYEQGHIPNSINIGRKRLETWVGILVPWDARLVLCGSPEEITESASRLARVGYHAEGVTMDSWKGAGLPVAVDNPVSPQELYGLMEQGKAPVMVDVRRPKEWMALRIGAVLNLPLNRLSELCAQLDPAQPVVVVCRSGYRSSMAAGILERKGFALARNLTGGTLAWLKAGYPVISAQKDEKQEPVKPKKIVPLPERLEAGELARMIMDLPGTFELVDIRPPEHFADFHLPGSVNVDLADLISDPAYLTGPGPLVIVDRDGSLAMAVGGILSQKTGRTIKVLYGGIAAYWSQTQGDVGAIMAPPLTGAPSVSGPT